MSKIIDGSTYYTLEESSKMLDKSIEHSADLLISELKLRHKDKSDSKKELAYV